MVYDSPARRRQHRGGLRADVFPIPRTEGLLSRILGGGHGDADDGPPTDGGRNAGDGDAGGGAEGQGDGDDGGTRGQAWNQPNREEGQG